MQTDYEKKILSAYKNLEELSIQKMRLFLCQAPMGKIQRNWFNG